MQDPTTHVRVFFSTLLQPPALGLKKPSGKKKGALASCPQETTQNHDQREREKKTHQKKKKRGEKINRENPFFWPYPRNCNPQQ
jgi:hypothetical protein